MKMSMKKKNTRKNGSQSHVNIAMIISNRRVPSVLLIIYGLVFTLPNIRNEIAFGKFGMQKNKWIH